MTGRGQGHSKGVDTRGEGALGGFRPPRFWDIWDFELAICVCTKYHDYILMPFIDTYMIAVFTELSATHGLVCSRQNNSDMLKLLRFEL